MVLEEENQECQVEQVALQESRSRGEQWSKIMVKGVGWVRGKSVQLGCMGTSSAIVNFI